MATVQQSKIVTFGPYRVDLRSGELFKGGVRRLRRVLGDSADAPHYIETLHRRGYRFVGVPSAEDGRATAPSTLRVRLAVLPFSSITSQVEADGFTDGLTEETIAQITH